MTQFHGPRRKVAHAKHHIAAIDGVLQEFLRAEPFRLSVVPGGIALHVTQELPDQVPLLIGDAVHNMRSALDLLACELVRLKKEDTNKVAFPFARDATDISEQIRQRKFNRAGADAVALLKHIGPYTGGNVLLRGIHDLDILDKHQLIIPTFNTAMVDEMTISANGRMVMKIKDCLFIGQRFEFGLPPGVQIDPGWKIRAVPAFGPDVPAPFGDSIVVKSLEQGADLVLSVIEAFERLRFGPGRSVGGDT